MASQRTRRIHLEDAMTNHIDDPDEQDDELRSRLRDLQPPLELQKRVTSSLQQAGLVTGPRASRPVWSSSVFRIAAGLLLFTGGVGARSAWDTVGYRDTSHADRF